MSKQRSRKTEKRRKVEERIRAIEKSERDE